ncbi:hypothetical protein MSIMFB_04473 [Mycobacterium simulans]|uniref:Uncharacterized protein n=1 Tax=Mycobacterium simulans TaxID=627089 RepID=A0A7Z7IR53_9MYCO|nr:hypothetical protein [Mycobacterium simulans]SOJ56995.1 hypothetical protein MSIMFB_04473 [Mycobacterium simulans]
MTDEREDLLLRYDLFWQLDFMLSAFGPDDVTSELAEKLLAILRNAALRAEKRGNPAPAPTIDLPERAEHLDTPTWEAGWARFKQDVRTERIRLGQKLGIEPETTTPPDGSLDAQ